MNKFSRDAAASLTLFNHAFTNMVIFVYAICFLANPVYADIVPAGEKYINGYAAFTNTNDMDVSVDGANSKLTVSGGTLTFSTAPSSSSDLPVTAGLSARYDASNPASVQVDGSGNVTAWLDSSGNNNTATIATGTNGQGALQPVKISGTGLSGNTTLDFDNGGNSYFNLNSRISDIRSVFWILKDAAPGSDAAFILGDSDYYDFHRGSGTRTIWEYHYADWTNAYIKSGDTILDGVKIDGTQTVLDDQWHLVSLVTTGNVRANSISGDRNNVPGKRSWTGEMGEILIYNQPLTDAEVFDVNCYLMNKWGLPVFSAAATTIDITEDSAIDLGDKTSVTLGQVSIADSKTLTINIAENKTTSWNSAISANGNANLKIVGNGAMSISSNLALGNNGSIVADGADVTINNPGNTIFDYSGAEIYINNGGSVTVSCPNGNDRFDIVSPTTITFGDSGGGSFNTGNMNGDHFTVNFVSFAEITFASTGGETNYITGSNGINLDSYNLTFNVARGTDPNGDDLVVSARLWNEKGVVKNGDGTLVISGANPYLGGTTINAGKLKVASGGTLGSGAIENRSIIEFAPAENETMSIGQYVWNAVETAQTIKSGEGILATTNWMNGSVEIQEGVLRLDNEFGANKRFDGQVTVASGATLLCNAHDSLGYGNGLNSRINIYGTMDNAVSNETLTNTDLYLYGGTASSSSGGTFDIYDSPVAKFYSFPLEGATETAPTVSTISSDVRLRTNGTLVIDTAANSQLNMTGVISDGGDNVACPIVKNGAGTLALSGANTYTDGTTINAGVVKLTDNAINTNGPIAIGANGTLEYNLTQGTKTLTIDNDNKKITGSGQITKTGAGTLQFYAENPNMVTADGFVVSSGRLDYKGYFEGDFEVLNGAILSPGNSTGTLNVTGGVAINGGIALFEFDSFASGQYDVLNILGDSNSFSAGNSMIELYFNSQDDAQAWADSLDNNSDGYKLVSDDGFAAGDYTKLLANYTDLFGLTGKSDGLYLVASSSPEPGSGVPEPSTWALLILGAAGLMYWRKRK